jgi:uncharacterized protein YdeI (YjbR/CyaY-like superfamily)
MTGRTKVAQLALLDVRTRKAWRAWLARNHDRVSEIWLVYQKAHTGRPSVGYEDSVNEALCYGWVDSLIRRVDDDRFARRFTPRKADSAWSTANRRRYAEMERQGLLAEPGRRRPPTSRSGDAPLVSAAARRTLERALREHRAAWAAYQRLPPSHQRRYLMWVTDAKRPETRARRLQQTVERLTARTPLGIK